MEGDGDRPLVEQRVEADEVPGFVGQDEERHRLARLGRGLAHALLFQSGDQPVHRLLKMRAKASHCVGKDLQPLSQRRLHVAGLDIGLVQRLVERFDRHLQAPLVLAAAPRPPIRKDPELLRFTPWSSIALRAEYG